MTENKYYTPSIDEFHIGFEYEMRTENIEGNTVYEKNTIREGFGNVMRELIRIRCIRVKRLDEQDIKECGFSICGIGQCGSENGQYDAVFFGKPIIYRNSKSTASTIWNPINGWVCISVNNNGRDNTLFAGTIKNKSELKRIMKMICIDPKD